MKRLIVGVLMSLAFLNGIRIVMDQNATIADYDGLVGQAAAEMIQFRETWGDDDFIAVSRHGVDYTLQRINGQDAIIMGPVPQPKGPGREMAIRPDLIPAGSPVLLAELGTSEHDPLGYAIFIPEEGGRLEFLRWADTMEDDTRDPRGIIGQETFRPKWFTEDYKEPPDPQEGPADDWVEQLHRVDQGIYAYNGDPLTEEITAISNTTVTSYEGIPHMHVWESVEPGPPPPEICGYTWDIAAEYGGPGEADRHDTRALFFIVKTGDHLAYWWPPNFNQYIRATDYWHIGSGSHLYKYQTHSLMDGIMEHGIHSASAIMLPSSIGRVSITRNASRRVWGAVYADHVDDYNADDDFPYTTTRHLLTTPSGAHITARDSGVYVFEREDLYITAYNVGSYPPISNWQVTKREPADPNDLPFGPEEYEEGMAVGILFDQFSDPGDLTEDQLTILEGNESMAGPWLGPDPFTERYHASNLINEYGGKILVINCAGVEYPIASLPAGEYNSGGSGDFGIFTTPFGGIDRDNNIIAGEVDPVYVFAMRINVIGEGIVGVIYGMIYEGQRYISDLFPTVSNGQYEVEGCDTEDADNPAPALCGHHVRAGWHNVYVEDEIVEYDEG